MHLPEDKASLRDRYKQVRINLTESVRRSAERRILEAARSRLSELQSLEFGGLPQVASELAVALYAPTQAEVDLTPLLSTLRQSGWIVTFPRILPGRRMAFCEIDAMNQLVSGAYGIRAPGPDRPVVPMDKLAVAFVPGLAFTPTGERLGYGGGYYDRYFAKSDGARVPLLVGVCFDEQFAAWLPVDEHDVQMDYVLTNGGVIPCRLRE